MPIKEHGCYLLHASAGEVGPQSLHVDSVVGLQESEVREAVLLGPTVSRYESKHRRAPLHGFGKGTLSAPSFVPYQSKIQIILLNIPYQRNKGFERCVHINFMMQTHHLERCEGLKQTLACDGRYSLKAGMDTQLKENPLDVITHGGRADHQHSGYGFSPQALSEEPRYL